MKEANLQKAVLDYLTLKKFVVVKFNNVGVWNKKTNRYIPPRQKGISDILACNPEGKFIALEIKNKNQQPSKYQIEFLERVRKNNGIGMVVYSMDEVMKIL